MLSNYQAVGSFKDWGYNELGLASQALDAYSDQKLTRIAKAFWEDDDELNVIYDQGNDEIYIGNSEGQLLILVDDKLDLYITTDWSNYGGHLEDLMLNYDLKEEDIQGLLDKYSAYMEDEESESLKEQLNQ